jgi:hypothetical protein
MEWDQNEEPGNVNIWTALSKIVWLSETLSEMRQNTRECRQAHRFGERRWLADGRWVGGQQWKQLTAANWRLVPTCTIHCISWVAQRLCVYVPTPKLTSPPICHSTFHTHIAENSTTFFLTSWNLPFLKQQRLSPWRTVFNPRQHFTRFDVGRMALGNVSPWSLSFRQYWILTL